MAASMFPVPLSGIQTSTLTTTGDTIYASAANSPARLGIGSTGQVLTVASGVPSWATPSTPTFVGCVVTTVNQSLTFTGGTGQKIGYTTEVIDTDGFHSNVTNTSRLTVPSGKAGKYLITWQYDTQGTSNGDYIISVLQVNNTNVTGQNRGLCGNVGGNGFNGGTISMVADLAVGDYVDSFYQQGASNTISFWARFSITYLGA